MDSDTTLVPVCSMLSSLWVVVLVTTSFTATSCVGFLWPVLGPHLALYGLDAAVGGLFIGLASVSYALLSGFAAACLIRRCAAVALVGGVVLCAAGFVVLGPALPPSILPFEASLQVVSMACLGGGAGVVSVTVLPLILRDRTVRKLGSGAVETGSRITASAAAAGEAVGPVVAGLLVTLFGDQGTSDQDAFARSCQFAAIGLVVMGLVVVIVGSFTRRCGSACGSEEEQSLLLGHQTLPTDGNRDWVPGMAPMPSPRMRGGIPATVTVRDTKQAFVMVL